MTADQNIVRDGRVMNCFGRNVYSIDWKESRYHFLFNVSQEWKLNVDLEAAPREDFQTTNEAEKAADAAMPSQKPKTNPGRQNN